MELETSYQDYEILQIFLSITLNSQKILKKLKKKSPE